MKSRFEAFVERNKDSKQEAIQIVENEIIEIELYEKYKDYYGYGFYIAEKV